LAALEGADLRGLAEGYGITVWREGRRNKGWAGQTVERFLGQRPNARQGADFGDWELKVVPMVSVEGGWRLKETMAITMLSAGDLETQDFAESHLLEKLERIIVVARSFEAPDDAQSTVLRSAAFDLEDGQVYAQVAEDYEEIRWVVREQGVYALTGHLGQLVQPRPKGGKGSDRMGFYARKRFVARMLGL
jgi:DNA mismatch repair protein MutH